MCIVMCVCIYIYTHTHYHCSIIIISILIIIYIKTSHYDAEAAAMPADTAGFREPPEMPRGLRGYMYVYIYIYIYIYIYMHTHKYIDNICYTLCVCVYIYIYTCIHIYTYLGDSGLLLTSYRLRGPDSKKQKAHMIKPDIYRRILKGFVER